MDNRKTSELINSNILRTYSEENKRIKTHSEKATKIVTIVGIILALSIQVFSVIKNLNVLEFVVYGISITLLFVSIILSIVAMFLRPFRADPNPKNLVRYYSKESYKTTLDVINHNLAEATIENHYQNLRISRYINGSLKLMIAGIVSTLVFTLIISIKAVI